MASTITSHFSSAPLTDELVAPLEVQRADDFRSNTTTRSTTTDSSLNTENIDWTRLYGYIATPRLSKRPKSWVWLYGIKIKQITTN